MDGQINLPIELNVRVPMAVRIEVAKFKCCQYQRRAISTNLVLAKVTRYTVVMGMNTLAIPT